MSNKYRIRMVDSYSQGISWRVDRKRGWFGKWDQIASSGKPEECVEIIELARKRERYEQ